MKEPHREKNGKNETRARALAASDRNYWVGLLKTVDTWFPVYRVRHPDADREEVVAHLAALVDERRRRGFSDESPRGPAATPESAVLFEPRVPSLKGVWDCRRAELSCCARTSRARVRRRR